MSIDKPSHPIDVHVGGKVRLRRKFLGLSQQDLADAIGLTFQQVQKYERGSNRISASKLYEIGRVLTVPVGYFFAELTDPPESLELARTEKAAHIFLMTPEGIELAEAFPRIKAAKQRRKILELVRSLAHDTD